MKIGTIHLLWKNLERTILSSTGKFLYATNHNTVIELRSESYFQTQ